MRKGVVRRVWTAGCVALLLLAQPLSMADARRGRVGFTVYVEVDGSYATPILKSVRVQEIEPGSPAEAGGLKVDDLILKAQGKPLQGANARTVAAMVQVPPGEKLRLVVRGANGSERQVTIVAGPPVRS
ncbi:MAG TPA: PDZ domain-containing protein, partial [Burkholderiaceae bacterium]|nr:PDZ domain-containing protein [Burkholderiaceae bacterium]